jgi:hypothetical protein
MADFQTDVLDRVAQVVGGAKTTNDPHFFSGAIMDGGTTGVAGLTGCYSSPPEGIQALPVGIVLSDNFKADLASLGEEDNEDFVHVLILVAPFIAETQRALLMPYRDTVPAAFRAQMQLYDTTKALDAFITEGHTGVYDWGGIGYLAWDFTIRVRRMVGVTYVP